MKRRTVALAVAGLVALSMSASKADPPVIEARVVPGVSKVLPAGPCSAESAFELGGDRYDGAAPYDKCERLKVVFGPIWAKPGQNDVLIQPVTFEKPMYPGYLTRFKPDLVTADGNSPRVKDLHLHHGTWLNPGYLGVSVPGGTDPGRPYGWGPWIASGEEKTIAVWPKGYGVKILPSDQWLFLHMIHNATPQTFPVWVTYTLDFIPQEVGDAINPDTGKANITNTKGVWLDVGDCSWSSQCEKDSFNPIFNIQRGFGQNGECVFPLENCANQNVLAEKSAQQGNPLGPTYDDWTIPESGTLVVMGGHLHFGGLRDEVSLVRAGNPAALGSDCKVLAGQDPQFDSRLIHISDALYWDQDFDPSQWKPEDAFDLSKNLVGGVPTSWDMIMTGVTKDTGWSINVQRCDRLRLEGVYDSTVASWYEQMGIVMAWLAPGESTGLDPFDPTVSIEQGLNIDSINPQAAPGYTLPGSDLPFCDADAKTICVRGQGTLARIPPSGDHWSCSNLCPAIPINAPDGPIMTDIAMGGFTFGAADFSVIPTAGIPLVEKGTPVTFWNLDTADYMWHTVTRCALPCSGSTSASYPIANGAWDDLVDADLQPLDPSVNAAHAQALSDLVAQNGPDLAMDFDSGQIGYGTGANNKLSWEFTPTRTGDYAFFCRIHPGMRGAFRVVDAA